MSQVYPKFLESLWSAFLIGDGPPAGEVELFVCGVTSGYVYNEAHTTIDVLTGHVLLAEKQLESVNIDGGYIQAADVRYPRDEVPGGNPDLKALVVYAKWAGGSQLMAYFDDAVTTLPLALTQVAQLFRWHQNGMFRI